MGATLAGILYYSGEIKSNIENKIPIHQWSFEAILAYFSSNSNKYLSFSGYFSQTRVRLYIAARASYNGKGTKVAETYMSACAEENGNFSITSRGLKPTHHLEEFIREFQKKPNDFEIYTQTRSRGILKEQKRLIDEWLAVYSNGGLDDEKREGMVVVGPKTYGFYARNQFSVGFKPGEILGVSSTEVISLDVSKYQPYLNEYRILAGLLKTTQSFRTHETVDIPMMDDLTDKLDGLKVTSDIGVDITRTNSLPQPPLNMATMSDADLARFNSILTLNFE